jgi:hypothetical protein
MPSLRLAPFNARTSLAGALSADGPETFHHPH